MRNRLKKFMKTSLNKKKKKANETVDELKDCLLQAKKFPTGIITSAAELAGCDTCQMRAFIENRPGMTNVEEWKVVVDRHFDETLESLTSRLDSMTVSSSSTTTNTVEEEQFRTFTASFDKLIRKDIPLNIKEVILKKFSFSMSGSTDFVVCFSTLVRMLLIQLKNSRFVLEDNDSIVLCQAPGFSLASIIPQSAIETELTYTIASLDERLIESNRFDADFSKLFIDQHFEILFSQFFGVRGPMKNNFEAHPVQNALILALEQNGITKQTFDFKKPPSEAMKVALEMFKVNFKNMWTDKKIINKLLDKVILVLLRLHLAESRESQRKRNILKKPQTKQDGKRSLKNHARLVCRTENKKIKKLYCRRKSADPSDKEKWTIRIAKAEIRLECLKGTFKKKITKPREGSWEETEVIPDEEEYEQEAELSPHKEKQPLVEDASSRRIGQLKSIVKHLVFSQSKVISENDVKAQSCDTTDKEISACILIANTVKLFIPSKEKYNTIVHQLYFCIWANDVLKYAGYSKFTMELHPSTSFSSLNALHLNAPTLYQLLTQELT
ncbi:hypothetical protein RMATCC62417_10179 [Rhizopus microsporus]|nr:hypothetical protein RMATCC62417_10179 [Rhizopus microsporus]